MEMQTAYERLYFRQPFGLTMQQLLQANPQMADREDEAKCDFIVP